MIRWTEKDYEAFLKGKNKKASKVSKKSTTGTVIAGGYQSRWSGWATIAGEKYYFRSLWERNYAHYLQWEKEQGNIAKWDYEPKRFYFKEYYSRGPYDYLPDFKVWKTKSNYAWHEVKGFMNSKSKSKIKRFEKHYPKEGKVVIIDSKWFKNMKNMSIVVPGWKTLKELTS